MKTRPNQVQLESTLMRLSEMVARRLREAGISRAHDSTQTRYKDFTTITRAHAFPSPTQLDTEIFEQIRTLFRKNWKRGARFGCWACTLRRSKKHAGQMDLLEGSRHQRWNKLWPPPINCATNLASPASD